SNANSAWTYIGCSHQRVPSLSKTAIRSAGFTKSREPSAVAFATNSMIAFLEAPSFHDGSGSCARANPAASQSAKNEVIRAVQFKQSLLEQDSNRASADGDNHPGP